MEPIIFLPLAAVAAPVLVYLWEHPEIAFALFLFSYILEGGADLLWFFNLTLVLFAVSIGGFTHSFLKEGQKIPVRAQWGDVCLLAFSAVFAASSFLSPVPEAGFAKALRFFGAVVLPYAVARLFLRDHVSVRRFLDTIAILAIMASLALVCVSLLQGSDGRIYLLNANPIPTALLLVVGLAVAGIRAVHAFRAGNTRAGALFSASTLFLLYGTFLAGVRGPVIAGIAGIAVYLLAVFKGVSLRNRILATGIAAVCIAGLYLALPVLPNGHNYTLRAISQGISTQQRLEQYALAGALFRDNPVLGIGSNGFEQRTGWAYPHNIFAEVAVETGFVGLVLFGCFLGFVAVHGVKFVSMHRSLHYAGREIGLAVLVVAAIIFIEKQFSFGLAMHKELFVFLALLVNLPHIAGYAYGSGGVILNG
jgi:O-antigen ligase